MASLASITTGDRQFMTATAEQDEALDHLAWRVTGSETALPELMEINPHLTSPLLAASTAVKVPVRTTTSSMREAIQLWSK